MVFQQKEGDDVERLPPIAKVYEVYNALADDRIVMKGQEAFVDGSDYTKMYIARFHDDEVPNNDSATIWQHYPGRPVLAVWMKLGILPVNWNIPPTFVGINRRKRNTEHKDRYEEVIEELLSECEEQDYAYEDIHSCMQEILETVVKFPHTTKDSRASMICKRMKTVTST